VAVLLTTAGDHVPVIPLVEVAGSTGAGAPLQIIGSAAKDGVVFGVTFCIIVVESAHCPAVGVKVYMPVAVLLTVAGDHVPVIPSCEVVGNTGGVLPLQIAGSAAKAGVIFGVTTCVKVVDKAHCPAAGVKV